MVNFLKTAAKFLFVSTFMLGCGGCHNSKGESGESIEEVSLVTWEECGYQQGEHMCDFTLKDQNGDDFSLYDHIGRPIILDYSTMWCGYCQVAAYEVSAIQDAYSDYDLLYVTILVEDTAGNPADETDCENWSGLFGIIDPPVLAGSRDLLDSNGVSGVQIAGWPSFLFLTDEMVIHSTLRGYSSAGIEQGIQNIIAE